MQYPHDNFRDHAVGFLNYAVRFGIDKLAVLLQYQHCHRGIVRVALPEPEVVIYEAPELIAGAPNMAKVELDKLLLLQGKFPRYGIKKLLLEGKYS